MTFMPWSDDFSVGMDRVDQQHHWLVDMTNLLHEELGRETLDRRFVQHALEGLVDYTVNHFILEEELFQRCNYPGAQAHKQLHDRFTATIMQVLTDFEAGGDVGSGVLDLLKNWLTQHILIADKAYMPYVGNLEQTQSVS
jgi:hemerythrin